MSAVVGNDLLPVVLVGDGHDFLHRRTGGNTATGIDRALFIRDVADHIEGLLDLQELHDGLVDEDDCDQRRERLLRETRYVRHSETMGFNVFLYETASYKEDASVKTMIMRMLAVQTYTQKRKDK